MIPKVVFHCGMGPSFDFIPPEETIDGHDVDEKLLDPQADPDVGLVVFMDWEPIRECEAAYFLEIMGKLYSMADFLIGSDWAYCDYLPASIIDHPRFMGKIEFPHHYLGDLVSSLAGISWIASMDAEELIAHVEHGSKLMPKPNAFREEVLRVWEKRKAMSSQQ